MVGKLDFFTGNSSELSSDIQELQTPEGELHLRFFLPSGDEFALAATGVRVVMQQPPDRIVPIPNASPLLLGTTNLRGQVIWVADLGQFLGDSGVLNTERPEIPVIAIEDQETILGLAVEKLGGTDWLPVEKLQAPNNIPDQIAPFVQKEWVLDPDNQKVLRLLDHVAVLRSARWAA
jgi:purine-binding chemotaxis protein CheW